MMKDYHVARHITCVSTHLTFLTTDLHAKTLIKPDEHYTCPHYFPSASSILGPNILGPLFQAPPTYTAEYYNKPLDLSKYVLP